MWPNPQETNRKPLDSASGLTLSEAFFVYFDKKYLQNGTSVTLLKALCW